MKHNQTAAKSAHSRESGKPSRGVSDSALSVRTAICVWGEWGVWVCV